MRRRCPPGPVVVWLVHGTGIGKAILRLCAGGRGGPDRGRRIATTERTDHHQPRPVHCGTGPICGRGVSFRPRGVTRPGVVRRGQSRGRGSDGEVVAGISARAGTTGINLDEAAAAVPDCGAGPSRQLTHHERLIPAIGVQRGDWASPTDSPATDSTGTGDHPPPRYHRPPSLLLRGHESVGRRGYRDGRDHHAHLVPDRCGKTISIGDGLTGVDAQPWRRTVFSSRVSSAGFVIVDAVYRLSGAFSRLRSISPGWRWARLRFTDRAAAGIEVAPMRARRRRRPGSPTTLLDVHDAVALHDGQMGGLTESPTTTPRSLLHRLHIDGTCRVSSSLTMRQPMR